MRAQLLLTTGQTLEGTYWPYAAKARQMPPSDLVQKLAAEGVFKGFCGLEGIAECDEFWQDRPYGTRLYYGSGGFDYLHRDVLRAAVRALKRPNSESSHPGKEL